MSDPTKDPRYGQPGWTLIYPLNGGTPYFVKQGPRKQRASPRALRFANLRVGDVLMRKVHWTETRAAPGQTIMPVANSNHIEEIKTAQGFAICEHRWTDPVRGEHDPVAGQLVAVRWITARGLAPSLTPHTIRGLASQGYHPMTDDQARHVLDWLAQRDAINARHEAGEITVAEARMIYRPWAMLLRDVGLEEKR